MASASALSTPSKCSIARDNVFMPEHYTTCVLKNNTPLFAAPTNGPSTRRVMTELDRFFKRVMLRAASLGLRRDKDIAKFLGASQQTFSNWKQRGYIPPARHEEVADKLGCTIDELLNPDRVREQRAAYGAVRVEIRSIPVVGNTQAGFDVSWDEMGYPAGHADLFVSGSTNDNGSYALVVRGDSMWPRMREGDAVVTAPNSSPTPGDEVVVKFKNGDVAVKILAQSWADTVALDSYNAPRMTRSMSEIEFMHVVVGIHPPGALIQSISSA